MSRVMGLVLALTASLASAVVLEPGDLVSYSFDDGSVEAGPDTFIVFEHADGRVDLSSDFYVTAYESVVVEDVAGNGAFPELQGYFPQVDDGKLYVQFYLLPTQPDEELNVALAGPARFNVEPQGIALWLVFRAGRIEHVSDGMRRVLVPHFDPFTWYRFDIAYDVDAGSYDVDVGIGDEPAIVRLRDQPNAPGSPGSGVGIFSFIGDLRDRSQVRYYVDALNIGRNDIFRREPGTMTPRPARPSLVDRQIEVLQSDLDERPGFLPIRGASERDEVNAPYVAGLSAFLAHDPDRALRLLEEALRHARPGMERALCLNARGVVLLAASNPVAARRDFSDARAEAPALVEATLNSILTAARQRDWRRAFDLADDSASLLRDDDRALALKAKMWMMRNSVATAAAELVPAADAVLVGYRMLLDIAAHGSDAVTTDEIEAYAAAHAGDPELQELAGDVFFKAGDYRQAIRQYTALAGGKRCSRPALGKAAEACDRLGDASCAREFRERAYGRL